MFANSKQTGGNGSEPQANQQQVVNFTIQRLYIKDLSFESPQSPKVFASTDWKPEVNIELSVKNEKLEANNYEVLLLVTVTLKHQEQTVLVCEAKQAGIFTIDGLEGERLNHVLASYCPNILFPYVREVISDVVVRGGFPQLLLAPVNFDALYEESKKQAANR